MLRASNLADLLALVRYSVGYTPTDSAVLVAVPAAAGTPHMARIDAAALMRREMTESTLEILQRTPLREVILVIYQDEQSQAAATYATAVATTPQLAEWCTTGAVWASPTHYGPLETTSPSPISDVDESHIAAYFVSEGNAPAASREALADEFAPAPVAARRAAAAAGATITPSVEQARDLWESTEVDPTPQAYGRLAAVLTNGHARDRILAYITTGEWHEAPDVIAKIGSERPAADRMDHYHEALALLAATAAHSPGPGAAGALACAAFVHWWRGDGTRANVWVDAARDEDADNRLAALVHTALAAGMPPMWAQ